MPVLYNKSITRPVSSFYTQITKINYLHKHIQSETENTEKCNLSMKNQDPIQQNSYIRVIVMKSHNQWHKVRTLMDSAREQKCRLTMILRSYQMKKLNEWWVSVSYVCEWKNGMNVKIITEVSFKWPTLDLLTWINKPPTKPATYFDTWVYVHLS